MTGIEQQLELERRMSERGRENYRRSVQKAEANGRGHETQASKRLMREFIEPLAEKLEAWANIRGPGMNGLYRPLIRTCDPYVAIYLALCSIFDHFTMDASLASLAIKIGGMVEDDLRFTLFREKHKNYYEEILRDLSRKHVKSYDHKKRLLTFKANEAEDEWPRWSPSERVGVGIKLIDIILANTDIIKKVHIKRNGKGHGRKYNDVKIVPTEQAHEWIAEHHAMRELMFPERLPCIIEPDDWTDLDQGGYYSAELRNTTRLIKTQNKEHRQFIRKRFDKNKQDWLTAINSIQKTPWSVNERVLDVIKEVWKLNLAIGMPAKEPLVPHPSPVQGIPKEDMTDEQKQLLEDWKHEASEVYTAETEREAKSFQLVRILRMANEFKDYSSFWYVWTFDFRGRMYTSTSGFSPQGPDIAKGMLRFANGKPLGARGFYWLKVNMANRFGYDKEDNAERVRWVDDQQSTWLAIAEDPINARDHWSGADKPYQFLASVFEYANAVRSGDPHSYVSHVPVGLDGSCNGLQHFSAMLRDSVGGAATNLVPQDKPADIYSRVGAVCGQKILGAYTDRSLDPEVLASMIQWKQFLDKYGKEDVLPRSLPKRPVMTLPYGATRQSCTKYIYEAITKIDTDKVIPAGRFRASVALTPLMWSSIGEVVIAARVAMAWLQKCAGIVGKENRPLFWDTPDGFPVWQAEYKTDDIRVRTQLAGDFRIRLNPYIDEIDSRKMRSSASPNFVHSADANHLRAIGRRCEKLNITDLAFIHDDCGTHACNTDALHKIIRETFVEQYTLSDPIPDFYNFQSALGYELPEPPEKGSLDIKGVLQSEYFFG